MFGGAAAFLAIALIAAVLGFSGIAATSINIAWVFFLFGMIFAAVFYVVEQRQRQRH
ncbi:MAG: DUF1328 family protein [Woeseia sp.]